LIQTYIAPKMTNNNRKKQGRNLFGDRIAVCAEFEHLDRNDQASQRRDIVLFVEYWVWQDTIHKLNMTARTNRNTTTSTTPSDEFGKCQFFIETVLPLLELCICAFWIIVLLCTQRLQAKLCYGRTIGIREVVH
jgi:hypothetical protein